MIRVKICGITNLDDALAAATAGADALGFNFWPQSPRHIDPRRAAEIITRLPPFVTPVGVFVNLHPSLVQPLARMTGINTVQLHGDESPEDAASLVANGLSVWKAFLVGRGFRPERLERYVGVAAFLLDSEVNGQRGGTGKTFDCRIARQANRYGKILLAGGLTVDNVAEAIRLAEPYGVDVCTGVEKKPGMKDHARMRQFIQRARGAQTGAERGTR